MNFAVIGLGKKSTHLLAGTQHTRGIFAVYEVPVLDELEIREKQDLVASIRPEWLVAHGFVHIDFSINMVYIGHMQYTTVLNRGDSQLQDPIQWQFWIGQITMRFVELATVVPIERLK
jgi:hypothetical protein